MAIKRPNPLDAVLLTGAQSVAGVKTFGDIPVLPASDPIAANEAGRKGFIDGKFADCAHLTGAQSVGGVKTFTSIPVLPASDPIAANEATRKSFVDGKAADYVQLTGAQNIGGVKTFTSIPVLPASDPSGVNEAARKSYVDSKAGGGRGAYSAIVYIDGDYTVAEDEVGTLIAENTNSKTAIQATNNALTCGGKLLITDGLYEIDNQITFNKANLVVAGEGIATVLKQTAAYDTMLNVTNDHIVLENLKINANTLGYSTIKYTNGSDYGRISNCFIQDPLVRGITGDTITDMIIENNKIIGSGGNGIVLEGTSNRGLVQGNSVINPGQYGIRFWNGTKYSTMVGNFVKNATAFGLAVHTSDYAIVSANFVDSCGLDNINIDNADYVVISGNNSYNSGESGIVTYNNCNFASITGNICHYNYHMGYNLDALRYSTVSGNIAQDNSRVGSNSWSGFWIGHVVTYQTAIHNVITGNFSRGIYQKYGIQIGAAADDYQIILGNNCDDNVTGGIYNPTLNSEVAHNVV